MPQVFPGEVQDAARVLRGSSVRRGTEVKKRRRTHTGSRTLFASARGSKSSSLVFSAGVAALVRKKALMASQPLSITSRRTLRNGLPSSAILCSFGSVPREQGNSARSLFDASRALRLIHRPRLSGSFCKLLEETSIVANTGDGFKSNCLSWLCPRNSSASAGKDGSWRLPCRSFWPAGGRRVDGVRAAPLYAPRHRRDSPHK